MSPRQVYLDYAATTPLDDEVFEAMVPCFRDTFGNPSSIHRWGQQADHAIVQSRKLVADVLNCDPAAIVFTSGGTESNNIALRGAALNAREERGARTIITTPVEHPSVLNTAQDLADNHGFIHRIIPVDQYGAISVTELESMIDEDIAAVAVIYANNEVGTINPISLIGELCQSRHVAFLSDAVQAANYCSLNVQELNTTLLSLGGHKIYGPRGVGVLYVQPSQKLGSLLHGGSQENGLRPGTESTPLIVGFARALQLAAEHRTRRTSHVQHLRDVIIKGVIDSADATLTGHPDHRLPNHASFVFESIDATQLVTALDLDGFGCSSGSACKVGNPEPSKVLLAMGIPAPLALSALRATVGKDTNEGEVQDFVATLPIIIDRLRQMDSAG
jgi:cysteine desulfurase